MALTLNGSNNTIAGLAVGGLPDGIVDTDMIAASAVTAAKRGAGAILQVVHGTYSTEVVSTSASYVDTGLSQAITPLKTGSSMFVLVCQHIYGYRHDSGHGFSIKLLQDSTARYNPAHTYENYWSSVGITETSDRKRVILTSYHSHGISAGTSTTYKTQMSLHEDNETSNIKAQQGSSTSMITIMEVG